MSTESLWLDEPISGDPAKDPRVLAAAFETLAARVNAQDLPSALSASSHKGLAATGADLAVGVPVTVAVSSLSPDAALWVVLALNASDPSLVLSQASRSFAHKDQLRKASRRVTVQVGALALLTASLSALVGGFLIPSFPDFFSSDSLTVKLSPLFAVAFALAAAAVALTARSTAGKVSDSSNSVTALAALAAPSVTLPVGLQLWLIGKYLDLGEFTEAGLVSSAGDSPSAVLANSYPELSALLEDGVPLHTAAALSHSARVSADRSVLDSTRFSLLWLCVPVSGAVLIGTIAGVVLPLLQGGK